MFFESVLLAFDRIRANLLRAALTMLGVVIGVSAVVALVSIGGAVQSDIDSQFSTLGADTLTIQPGQAGGSTGSVSTPFGSGSGVRSLSAVSSVGSDGAVLDHDDVVVAASTPGVEIAVGAAQTAVTVGGPSGEAHATLVATSSDLFDVEQWSLAAGSPLPVLADGGQLDVAVIGADVASDLGLDPAEAVGAVIAVDDRSFGVVGVLDAVGGVSFVPADGAVIVSYESVDGSLVDAADGYDQIRLTVTDDPELVAASVESALVESRGVETDDADFRVVEATSVISTAETISGTMTTMVTIIGGISLVVGAIGIANMMLVAVRERSREIGVRRAVGAARSAITTQFMVESVVLSVLGGLIGAVLGAVLATSLGSRLLGITTPVSMTAVIGAVAVSIGVGMAAGIWPAWQAARVDPTVALRYE